MFQIRPFEPRDQQQAVDLVLTVQREEFGMSITAADQPDLTDVDGHYRQGAGNFWVAKAGNEIVGTIGLLDIGGGCGALRKMFVKQKWRGREPGIAAALLEMLFAWAAERGLSSVYLGTTAWFHAAHRFYERSGFTEVPVADLPPQFPIMKVDTRFYRRDIANADTATATALTA